MSPSIPFSPACERNKDVILGTIRRYLAKARTVLEIGSGTAQHAVHFAHDCPHLIWQSSDQRHYLQGIEAQLSNNDANNVLHPFELDVNQAVWCVDGSRYDAIYTANTFHIMRWEEVHAFFRGLPQVINPGGLLIVYGPFRYQGAFTSASNQRFDESLRARGVGSAIRDFEAVNALVQAQTFELLEDVNMPANNQCLIWRSMTEE